MDSEAKRRLIRDRNPKSEPDREGELAEVILRTISRQSFADWYGLENEFSNGPQEPAKFEAYIQCDPDAPSKQEILQDIKRLFRLKNDWFKVMGIIRRN